MLAQNCPKGKRRWLNWSNLLFPDGQHRTGGSNCEMFEITWQVINIKSSFALKEKKAYQSHLITLYQSNEQLKMHKGEDLDCKVLSVMMRHLESFNIVLGRTK